MRSIQTPSNRMQSRKKLASGSLVLRLVERRAQLSENRRVTVGRFPQPSRHCRREASGDTMTCRQRPANPLENRMSLTAALPFVSWALPNWRPWDAINSALGARFVRGPAQRRASNSEEDLENRLSLAEASLRLT
jgi:hypothetical protein